MDPETGEIIDGDKGGKAGDEGKKKQDGARGSDEKTAEAAEIVDENGVIVKSREDRVGRRTKRKPGRYKSIPSSNDDLMPDDDGSGGQQDDGGSGDQDVDDVDRAFNEGREAKAKGQTRKSMPAAYRDDERLSAAWLDGFNNGADADEGDGE